MDALLSGIQWIADFFGGEGVKSFFSEWWAWALQKLTVWYVELKIQALQLGWSIGKGVLEDLQVSQRITDSLTMLPQEVRNLLNFFRIPECITNLLTAYVTRFVMRFIPG